MSCLLCKQPSVDSAEFEAGNNAEVPVSVPLCETHWNEMDSMDSYDFQCKYADQIEDLAAQKWVDLADALRDEAKYKGA